MNGHQEQLRLPPLQVDWVRERCARLLQPVALTGGTGFVGSHLLDALLAGGCSVRMLLRDRHQRGVYEARGVEVVVGDLSRPEALRALVRGAGTLMHLAGLVRASRREQFFAANARGTEQLVVAATEEGLAGRLVYVSSLAAAGPFPSPQGRAPEDPPAPISAYGSSKLQGERAVTSYAGPWVILRPPAIYGPRDQDVLQFFKMASKGVLVYPRGKRFLSVAFVGDVVAAIIQAAVAPHTNRIFHLGEPRPYPLEGLLRLLAEAGDLRVRMLALPAFVFRLAGLLGDGLHGLGFRRLPLTSDKVRELLAQHWVARTVESLAALGLPEPVSFADGARLTWAWYRRAGWLPHAKI
ncbi:MAG: NAD-dependent epimerase/dehydratase family protein [Thermoanaerobaculum sp.]|nr:NAD-dependent epimerase/dehydratase family protein [Thermoanaerobaculum sp.]MDW7966590.1 NAD-dependent epimerase/dehydratase family protein [Thermoanaerobaculum sp.]